MVGNVGRPERSTLVVGARALAILFVPLVVGSGGALLVALGRDRWAGAVAVLGGLGLAAAMLVAAACATHAFVRRRWWWGVGLLVGWPLTVPAYLWVRSRVVQG